MSEQKAKPTIQQQGQVKTVNIPTNGYYLFSTYGIDDNGTERILYKDMEPLGNQLLYVGDASQKASQKLLPLLLSDEDGLLYTTTVNPETLHIIPKAIFTSANPKGLTLKEKGKAIIPPADVVCGYLGQRDSMLDFSNRMQAVLKQGVGTEVALRSVPIDEMRPPKPIPKTGEDRDAHYRLWHQAVKQSGKALKAYIVPKTRAIFFLFTLDIYEKDAKKFLDVYRDGKLVQLGLEIKNAKTLDGGEGDLIKFVAKLTGTAETLPEGKYTISVLRPKEHENPKQWNNRVTDDAATGRTGDASYALTFDIKFSHRNLAGEFELVNADPISFEEALVQQFPQYYFYLLNDYIREERSELSKKETGDGSKTSRAIKPYFNQWQLSRDIACLGLDILDLEWEEVTKKDGTKEQKIRKKELISVVAKSLHDTFKKEEGKTLAQTLDLVFQTKSTIKAWGGMRKSIQQLLDLVNEIGEIDEALAAKRKATSTVKLAKELFSHDLKDVAEASGGFVKPLKAEFFTKKAWFGPQEIDEDYANKLAKTFGISQRAWNFIGKSLQVIDFAVSGYAIFDSIKKLDKATDEKATACDNLDILAYQYLEFLDQENPDELEYQLDIKFDTDEFEIKKEYTKDLMIVAEIMKRPLPDGQENKSVVIIEGHTDTMASHEHNEKLSENRANAVKNWLVKEGKVPAWRLKTRWWGERKPVVDGGDQYECEKNRRVVAIIPRLNNSLPACRQAINVMEKARYESVIKELKTYDAILDVLNSVVDFMLAVAEIIPLTAPAAMAISLAKAVYSEIDSVHDIIFDKPLYDRILDLQDNSRIAQDLMFESWANQTLMRQTIRKEWAIEDLPGHQQSTLHLRLRAEAIAGFLRLVVRASLAADEKKGLMDKLAEYKIEQYVHNFILRDGWAMPLHPPIAMSMDQFWLYAINDMNINPEGARDGFGIDKEGWLINQFDAAIENFSVVIPNYAAAKTAYEYVRGGFSAKGVVAQRMYVMSRIGCIPNHINATFQDHYPVHNIIDKNVTELAVKLKPDFGQLTRDIYEYMGIYQLDDDGKWRSLAQIELDTYSKTRKTSNPLQRQHNVCLKIDDEIHLKNGLYESIIETGNILFGDAEYSNRLYSEAEHEPNRPRKIVIIFKPGQSDDDLTRVNSLTPVSIQLCRYDEYFNNNGPVYKALARKLTKGDLEGLDFNQTQIDHFVNEGMYACIVEPFFQVGTVTMAGIKPTAVFRTDAQMMTDYRRGKLTRMKYGFTCKVGNNDSTLVKIPMHTKAYWPDKASTIDSFDDEITITLDHNKGDQALLLNRTFLATNSKDVPYPKFYHSYEQHAHSIGTQNQRKGEQTFTLSSFFKIGTNCPFYPLSTALPKNFSLSEDREKIYVDDFDWKTPVDYIFTATCTSPAFEQYAGFKQHFNTIRCSATFVNTEGWSDDIGPTLHGSNLLLIGKITFIALEENAENKNLLGRIAKYKNIEDLKPGNPDYEALQAARQNYTVPDPIRPEKAPHDIALYHFTPMAYGTMKDELVSFIDDLVGPNKQYNVYNVDNRRPGEQMQVKVQTISGISRGHHLIRKVFATSLGIQKVLPKTHCQSGFSSYYLFAAHASPSYKHPLNGNTINSVRPFGDLESISSGVRGQRKSRHYLPYKLENFSTTGLSSGGVFHAFDNPTICFRADNAINNLKPTDEFLKSDYWTKLGKDWKEEIENWIKDRPSDTSGPAEIFDGSFSYVTKDQSKP